MYKNFVMEFDKLCQIFAHKALKNIFPCIKQFMDIIMVLLPLF